MTSPELEARIAECAAQLERLVTDLTASVPLDDGVEHAVVLGCVLVAVRSLDIASHFTRPVTT